LNAMSLRTTGLVRHSRVDTPLQSACRGPLHSGRYLIDEMAFLMPNEYKNHPRRARETPLDFPSSRTNSSNMRFFVAIAPLFAFAGIAAAVACTTDSNCEVCTGTKPRLCEFGTCVSGTCRGLVCVATNQACPVSPISIIDRSYVARSSRSRIAQ